MTTETETLAARQSATIDLLRAADASLANLAGWAGTKLDPVERAYLDSARGAIRRALTPDPCPPRTWQTDLHEDR